MSYFKIEQNGTTIEILTRFIDIIKDFKSLEKNYTNSELVRKILRSQIILRVWKAKITIIQEATDLNVWFSKDLLGTLLRKVFLGALITHELTMKQSNEEEIEEKEDYSFQVHTKQKEDNEE